MIEIQCDTYDLKETLYSGQAFRWIELSQSLEQNITVLPPINLPDGH